MVGGPHSREKKHLWAAIYKKSPQNKLNLIKLYTLVIFEVFAGRIFETPELDLNHSNLNTITANRVYSTRLILFLSKNLETSL